jgi:ADP-L-glycero-D-manno-heptose 6-epimerase
MVIITGGAGFIGSCLAAHLNKEGENDIIIVDNLNSSDKWLNLVGLDFKYYEHKKIFIERITKQPKAFGNIRAVFHMGACSSTTESNADYLFENNVKYSQDIMNWALAQNARFIYASSAATYGNGEQGFDDETGFLKNLKPINRYGYSKHFFDLSLHRDDLFNKVAGLKFFNVFGPNEYHKQDMASVIFKAFHQITETGTLKLFKSYRKEYGDGEQLRDFVYIKDIVELMVWLFQNPSVNGLYNAGTGKANSWNQLASSVFKAMELPIKIEYIDMPKSIRSAYQYYTEAPMKKMFATGYNKGFSTLEHGIDDYVKNYLKKNQAHLTHSSY